MHNSKTHVLLIVLCLITAVQCSRYNLCVSVRVCTRYNWFGCVRVCTRYLARVYQVPCAYQVLCGCMSDAVCACESLCVDVPRRACVNCWCTCAPTLTRPFLPQMQDQKSVGLDSTGTVASSAKGFPKRQNSLDKFSKRSLAKDLDQKSDSVGDTTDSVQDTNAQGKTHDSPGGWAEEHKFGLFFFSLSVCISVSCLSIPSLSLLGFWRLIGRLWLVPPNSNHALSPSPLPLFVRSLSSLSHFSVFSHACTFVLSFVSFDLSRSFSWVHALCIPLSPSLFPSPLPLSPSVLLSVTLSLPVHLHLSLLRFHFFDQLIRN